MPEQPLSRHTTASRPETVTYDWEPLWMADVVGLWFARDRGRLFFHVSQVVTYQGRIPLLREWVE